MPELLTDIPVQPVQVRAEFLYDLQPGDHWGQLIEGAWIAVSSVPGIALGCTVLLENGALFERLPLHAVRQTPSGGMVTAAHQDGCSLGALQLWDCPSEFVVCHTYGHLAGHAVEVRIAGAWHPGEYLFTLDWHGSSYADDPGELGHKSGHVIALANGQFACQPANRCRFHDPAFVTPFTEIPHYKTNTHVWRVEGRRTTTSDEYFYRDVESTT